MDKRYTVTREYCGYKEPRWVARFCDEWIGQDKYKSGAVMLCLAHSDERDRKLVAC
jgi:hypothetical protein